MATEVVLPKLGLTQEEGTIVRWVKTEGTRVSKGEPLFEVLTDKATIEVEAPASGVLLRILVPEGATAAVATPIAVIGEPGERVAASAVPAGQSAAARPDFTPSRRGASAGPQAPAGITAHTRASAAAPATASADTPAGSTAGNAASGNGRIRVSPRARALAEANGVDLRSLRGSGPDGRIIERDVQQAIRPAAASTTAVSAHAAPSPAAATPRVTASAPSTAISAAPSAVSARLRTIIARRMTESLQTTAQLTLTTEVDMAEAESLRGEVGAELERREGVRPTYTDLIVRGVAIALRDHPRLNARWDGNGVRQMAEIHVGVAVSLAEGLVVPVVRRADRLTLAQISAAVRDLSKRARAFKLRPEEMEGGTFTVTNLGTYEIDAFTPILNPPEAAILGVGRVHRKPVAVNRPSSGGLSSPGEDPAGGADMPSGGDQVGIRPVVVLSLTFDHRIVDGAPAAQFLQRVKHVLEHPYLLLLP